MSTLEIKQKIYNLNKDIEVDLQAIARLRHQDATIKNIRSINKLEYEITQKYGLLGRLKFDLAMAGE